MASLRASLRGQTLTGFDLAHLVRNVNLLLYDSSDSNRYATFFFAEYDPATRQLTYVNAGHNAPVILRRLAVAGDRNNSSGSTLQPSCQLVDGATGRQVKGRLSALSSPRLLPNQRMGAARFFPSGRRWSGCGADPGSQLSTMRPHYGAWRCAPRLHRRHQ